MKQIILSVLTFVLLSCQNTDNTQQLENRIDSLEMKLSQTYEPGFGDFMTSIQTHHAKLWFAGQNENWELADFEVHEIEEAIEDIQKFKSDRPETKLLEMIIPPLDSIDKAIDQKDLELFKTSFTSFTNTCNKCHKAVDMEYIEIKIPDLSTFSNQVFTPKK